jgi:hypothetical protein
VRWLWAARLPDNTDAVHDGDTVRLELDLGFNQRGIYALRLRDVFAPELKQPGGIASRSFVEGWLHRYDSGAWPFIVETFRTKTGRDLTTLERYVALVFSAASPLDELNEAVQLFLRQHPEWGGGIGA